jgi:hypothetical protein
MKPHSCLSRFLVCAALGWVLGLMPGCGNVFIPKHKVLVDAIAAPGVTKPSGQSYRLLARKATVNNAPMQVPVVKACVDAALVSVGMFDAPPNVAPDVFIEVSYGADSGPRADPAARETFLQLSARSNPEKNLDKSTGPELWDVRVGVLGIAGRPESAMPLLASVAVNYIGTDTKAEAKVDIPQNAPTIASVRESAIRALEARSGSAPAPAAAGTASPGAAAPTGREGNGGSSDTAGTAASGAAGAGAAR